MSMPIPAGRRRRLPLAVATLVGLAAIVATYLVLRPGGDPPAASTLGRDDCVQVEVNASTEKGDLLAELADAYNRSGRVVGGGCAGVSVHKTTSGAAAAALAAGWDEARDRAPEPQVWTPTSSLWLGQLTEQAAAADRSGLPAGAEFSSIAQSPLVIAMPRPMAEALGWPQAQVGWSDLLALAQDPAGWGSLGHPEWGRFSLGKDNPNLSTSGLAATIATFYAATGLSSDLSADRIADPAVREFVAGVEAGVLHYSDDAVRYMANLAEADAAGQALSYVSAVVIQEQLLYLYNRGSPTGDPSLLGTAPEPRVPLAALYPADGTIMLDHPYVVLPSATDQQRAAAADFLSYLQEPAQQRRLAEHGFRDHTGTPGAELAEVAGIPDGQLLSLVEPPSPGTVSAILDAWDDLRKKANVLLVMDVSGSMNEPTGSGQTRLEAAKQAAIEALDLLHDEDRVGLWSFSTETGDSPQPYTEVWPLARMGESRAGLAEAIGGLHADGGTALYHTVRAAQQHLLSELSPDRITAVVVLTDGKNEYPADNDLAALLRDIDASSLEQSVRIFTIAFGEQSDLEVLTQIGQASRAAAYDARNPATIDRVFVSVISNF
jgi:Ca-activated chloride channel family protein